MRAPNHNHTVTARNSVIDGIVVVIIIIIWGNRPSPSASISECWTWALTGTPLGEIP